VLRRKIFRTTSIAALTLLASLLIPEAHAFGQPDASVPPTALSGWQCAGYLARGPGDTTYVFTVKTYGLALFKLRGDGTLDTSWGDAGRADLPAPVLPTAIAPLPDGSVLLLSNVVARLTPDGRVDMGYGGSGTGLSPAAATTPHSFALLPDGGLVIVTVHVEQDANGLFTRSNAFMRLKADGTLDTSFGRNGFSDIPNGGDAYAWSVNADGSYEIGRFTGVDATFQPQLHRGPQDGIVNGRLMPQPGIARWTAPWVGVDASGGMYFAVGSTAPRAFDTVANAHISLLRFDASGQRDTTFGGGATIPIAQDANMVVTATGKALWRSANGAWNVVVRVQRYHPAPPGPTSPLIDLSTQVARFAIDGYPDPSFAQLAPIDYEPLSQVARLDGGALVHTISRQSCTVERLVGDAPAEGTMVEYYAPSADRYFMTLEGNESTLLDTTSLGIGWKRTGRVFGAWSANDLPGTVKLCRFYGNTASGATHFYTPQGAECDALRQLDDATPATQPAWRFEGYAASVVPRVDAQTCPTNLTPVYRLYNKGFERGTAPNHRYTIDLTLYQSMQQQGWAGEGVAFCVPPLPGNVSTQR
jgi:hypothetical protein